MTLEVGVPEIEVPALFDCPRCGAAASQRFYGPCESCCGELRAKYPGIGRDMTAAEYVPKMNVTPNAVALKDD